MSLVGRLLCRGVPVLSLCWCGFLFVVVVAVADLVTRRGSLTLSLSLSLVLFLTLGSEIHESLIIMPDTHDLDE